MGVKAMKNYINEWLSNLNLSQEKLARAININRSHINLIISGKRNPSLLTAFKIAKFFNLKVDDLFYPIDLELRGDKK
jgi:putative transcriptional regulator